MVSPDTQNRGTTADWGAIRDRLWRAALALTRSTQDADDLTQQTMLTLLSRQPDRINHLTYARRTMLRHWLDEQRSLRRRLRRAARRAFTTPRWHDDVDSPSATESDDQIHALIDCLPPHQHAAIVLRVVEELSYKEIASTLDCTVQAVRANLHLARQKLRRTLEPEP